MTKRNTKIKTKISPFSHLMQFPTLFNEDPDEAKKTLGLIDHPGVDCSSHISGDPTLALKFFDHLWQHAYPGFNRLIFPTRIARRLTKDGILNVGILLEKAIAKKGFIKRDSTHGRDFDDLSDAKTVSVRQRSSGNAYSANITGIAGKQGSLRILCYERVQDRFYYFIIPYDIHSKLSYLEIPFDPITGSPMTSNKHWIHRVFGFDDLCK